MNSGTRFSLADGWEEKMLERQRRAARLAFAWFLCGFLTSCAIWANVLWLLSR